MISDGMEVPVGFDLGFGVFKLEPYADGIPIIDCAVGVEELMMGNVKAMYR